MFFLLFLVFFVIFGVDGFLCICSGYQGKYCPEGCEAGSYCYTTWLVKGGAVKDTGCVTTRADLTDQKCRTNRRGLVSCICNTEKCNDASFSIPSDVEMPVPPTIRCYNSDLNENHFCFGHYCTYSKDVTMNDFGDVFPGSYPPDRGCNYDEYSHDLNSVNICYMTNGWIRCKCNTEFCNKDQPFPVPIGHLLCYASGTDYSRFPAGLKYCRGHLCYRLSPDYDGMIARGCLSVSDGAPETLKKTGTYSDYSFCDQNLCNGDFNTDTPSIENVATTSAPS